MNNLFLICVVGPTAVGKTALAIEVANHFHAEIISADSRQFYRELKIGTAKPNKEELSQAAHHFIDSLSITDDYDVGRFENEAIEKIADLHKSNNVVVMAGGSGLFVNAVCQGLDEFPRVKEGMREKLNQTLQSEGLDILVKELEEKDPAYAEIVDLKNPQRVIRALEVIRSTGSPFSSFRKKSVKARPFQAIKIGLSLDKNLLYERINQRMDQMIEAGLFEEAKNFLEYKHLNALQTVGYQEIFPYLEGEYEKDEAIRLLKRNSRRYAKRQLTWFKKDESVHWFQPDQKKEILSFLDSELRKS